MEHRLSIFIGIQKERERKTIAQEKLGGKRMIKTIQMKLTKL